MERVCENCKWFVRFGEKIGECRRFPPKHNSYKTTFPIVKYNWWCGEFEQIINEGENIQEIVDAVSLWDDLRRKEFVEIIELDKYLERLQNLLNFMKVLNKELKEEKNVSK